MKPPTTNVRIERNECHDVDIRLPDGRILRVAFREGPEDIGELLCADVSLQGSPFKSENGAPLHKASVFRAGGERYDTREASAVFSTVLLSTHYYNYDDTTNERQE